VIKYDRARKAGQAFFHFVNTHNLIAPVAFGPDANHWMVFPMNRQETKQSVDPLLIPFLKARDKAEAQCHLEQIITCVTPIVEKITSHALSPGDVSQKTKLRVIELLWKLRMNSDRKVIRDFRRYVAVIASNARKKELRDECSQWHRLKDSLRHVLNNDARFALWKIEKQGQLCGMADWRGWRLDSSRRKELWQLLDDPHGCEAELLNGRDAQRLQYAELAEAIFTWVGGPIKFNDLVVIIFDLRRLTKSTLVSVTDEGDDGAEREPPSQDPTLNDIVEWRESIKDYLQRLWAGVEELRPLQRIVYLLNFRAERYGVKWFQISGVASMRHIGATLQLSDEHFARVWPELGEEVERDAEQLKSYDEKFALLLEHLPLNDNIIAKMLGTERNKVISLRSHARQHLSRNLAANEKVL
jgi:hypothetical protein